jgi:GxxExxY protein
MEHGGTETQRSDALSGGVIGACIEVHRHLGPGLLESAYEQCLGYELDLRGFEVQRQLQIPVHYKGLDLDCGYRIDLLVNRQLLIEVKAVERLLPVHEAQMITYLKLMGLPLGLLVNFHVPALRHGLRRLVNSSSVPSAPPRLPVNPSDPARQRSG